MYKFRLKPRKQKYYFNCYICDTKKEMYELYKKMYPYMPVDDNYAAIVHPYERYKELNEEWIKDYCIGDVLLYKGKLGGGMLSHEMLHCALWHDRFVNRNINGTYGSECGEAEERMAYLLYEYVRKLYNKLFTIGVWK